MEEIKIGIVCLDTSHVVAFTDILNVRENPNHIEGARVKWAFSGGTPGMPASINRVDGFTKTLKGKYGVEILSSIEEVVQRSDAILLESVDGRAHLPQFKKIAPSGKPVFIDKPFSFSLADAKEIKKISEKNKAPVFSTSAVRYDNSLQKALKDNSGGDIIGAFAYGPAPYEKAMPGLFWYGIHSAEMLFTALGKGIKSVRCIGNEEVDIATGIWKDGRVGTLRGMRKGAKGFGAVLFREKQIQHITQDNKIPVYVGLIKEIIKFFQTKISPVDLEETVEVMAFLEAANKSKQTGSPLDIS
jgi:predicted dehydrogenase